MKTALPLRFSALYILSLLFSEGLFAAPKTLPHPPSPPALPIWDAPALKRVCTEGLEALQQHVRLLELKPLDTQDTRFLADLNALQIQQEDVEGPVYLLNNVSPDPEVRQAAEACLLKYNDFSSNLFQNTALYQRILAVQPKDDIDAKLRQDLLDAFEDTGVALPEAQRKRMKQILEKLEIIRQHFSRNLRDDKTRLTFTLQEAEGLPQAYLDRAMRDAEGRLRLSFDYPDYVPFMENAKDGEARRRYQAAYTRRGGEQNIALLDETLQLRREMAALFGFKSYAEFVTRRRMVGNPALANRFLDEVLAQVRNGELHDLEELRRAKAEEQGRSLAQTRIERWDVAYYQERIKRQRYDIDQEALRRYFPAEASIAWALSLSAQLYGLRFEARPVQTWHPDVRHYDVLDATHGDYLGSIYLDLYPREGKYTHAAAFGVRGASRLSNRTPISVLVTNFNRQGLDFNELETLMHEFGHVLHGVLSRTRYAAQAGTSVETDFVEAPSQMYEEWAHKLESVRQIAHHCKDCPTVDAAMMERLNAARKFGRGIRYARQHLYASYDLALYGPRALKAQPTWEAMEAATPLGHTPGTLFPAQFEHILRGYGAGYYSYMWSQVLAMDMLSAFGNNIMNPTVAGRFRKIILERGGERRASEMVRDFLGREPSPKAFFEEISGEKAESAPHSDTPSGSSVTP